MESSEVFESCFYQSKFWIYSEFHRTIAQKYHSSSQPLRHYCNTIKVFKEHFDVSIMNIDFSENLCHKIWIPITPLLPPTNHRPFRSCKTHCGKVLSPLPFFWEKLWPHFYQMCDWRDVIWVQSKPWTTLLKESIANPNKTVLLIS